MEAASSTFFCLSDWPVANSTTKNANSRVMKSAYETSQRSWLTCPCLVFRIIHLPRARPALALNDEGAHDLINVREALHDLDHADHRADDADRRRKSSGGFEDLRNALFALGFVFQFEAHDLTDRGRFGAINCKHQRLFEEWVLDHVEICVE